MAKKKGYRFPKSDRTMLLKFDEDHALSGLEIEVRRRVPVGVVISATTNDMGEAVRLFANEVVAWNVEDDEGRPVPPTVQMFGQYVGMEEMQEIIQVWSEVLAVPDAPLGRPSSDTGTSEAA